MLDECLRGRRLYGDDFGPEAVADWYQRETHRYFDLARSRGRYAYIYHAMNQIHAWRWLPGDRRFRRVLGVGSAWGDEFAPIAHRCDHITLVDVAGEFAAHHISGVPVQFVEPHASGALPLESAAFDLVICLAALQHMATVTKAVHEMVRCLAPGGYLCLRDSIVSGNFHQRMMCGEPVSPRGIPAPLFDEIVRSTGLELIHADYQFFTPLRKVWKRLTRREIYLSPFGAWLDRVLSCLFAPNYRYHAAARFHHFRPASRSFVLRKPDSWTMPAGW